jgi:hypothetical protein
MDPEHHGPIGWKPNNMTNYFRFVEDREDSASSSGSSEEYEPVGYTKTYKFILEEEELID